jgi:hypothetical protein
MIYAQVIFWSNGIKYIDLVLPYPPRVGETIQLPLGTVKYNNGLELDESFFKISNIDWVFEENSMIPKYKFKKLSIYVECPH